MGLARSDDRCQDRPDRELPADDDVCDRVRTLDLDYEVFLISRIREDYDQDQRSTSSAVARGLASIGRVVMSGASIMVVVFLSFVPS